ncbi:hypothetical protein NO004_120010 [Flavobacterium psychrophilum]|uniref:hypothetical protein n=1 Tax=Flavobacterium psychrophilum TaxID=96345 RepID=UPI000B7C4977|nr:hypothetical protein [Flavobacterium psychrophilum]SNB23894.1 hypothetical protein NO004_120010 [Flavobacterium psychrophilum]
MNTSSEIVKAIVLPYLERDAHFENSQTNPDFWNHFVSILVHFESDAQPLYTAIYSLKLENAEPLITSFSKIYNQFVKELAESHVLGNTDETINRLLTEQNTTFYKEVTFFKTLQQAIKNVERKRIKNDLPKSINRLTFELSDEDISLAAKKKGREDLKAKMKEWDKLKIIDDVKKSETLLPKAASIPTLILFNKKIVISKLLFIQWLKYSILIAVIGVTGTIVYKTKFEKKESKISPTEVSTSTKTKIIDTLFVKSNDTLIEEEDQDQNLIIDSSQIEKGEEKEVKNVKHSGMNIKKDYKAIYYNIKPKIDGLFKYLIESQEENNTNKKYKAEYDDLNTKLNKYILIGKLLTIYKEKESNIGFILTDESGNLYFYDGKNYYGIIKTSIPLEFKIIEDSEIIEELNIIIEYGT